MRREEVPGGEAPVVEGDEGDRFYVVLNGIFAVSNLGSMPRRMLVPATTSARSRWRWTSRAPHPSARSRPSTVASCDKETFDEFLRPLFADDDELPATRSVTKRAWLTPTDRART